MQIENEWERRARAHRCPSELAAQWQGASEFDASLLAFETTGDFWPTLRRCGVTLIVTREYEHLVVALRPTARGGEQTFQRLPHPSGVAFDARRGVLHVASTRNPNQVFDFQPMQGQITRRESRRARPSGHPLVPTRARMLPGCAYVHDLAIIGGRLFANTVGLNAVSEIAEPTGYRMRWWPKCVERNGAPRTDRNYLQLNSIAAGRTLGDSFFTASTDSLRAPHPGEVKFDVDRRGVLFSGCTREVVTRGLTRPHSARLHRGVVWLDNSGYGEVGSVESGKFLARAKLPGWTRGLGFAGDVAFVGTSRILKRFEHYAPGLRPANCVCGVHALEATTGRILGSLIWPNGNQIFAVEPVPTGFATGFVQSLDGPSPTMEQSLFYSFQIN